MEDDDEESPENSQFNFQYQKQEAEEFEVVIAGINFLILKNMDGNNTRVSCLSASSFSVGEKIYKENGRFTWEKL
jgi:hypothetical protein